MVHNTLKNNDKKLIFTKALIIRLIALCIIFGITPDMSVGFLSDSYLRNDDVRFEAGGMYYAENAKSVIDFSTFKQAYGSVGDWVGYKTGSLFNTLALWYWMICILLYFTKRVVFVRLLNIILSSVACVLLYDFASIAYNEKIAAHSTKLLMYLPYPVIFSCFAYRDHMIMCLTLVLLLKTVQYQKQGQFSNRIDWVIFGSAILLLLMLRSGLPIILIILCMIIMVADHIKKINIRTFLFIMMGLVVIGILLFRLGGNILFKLSVYVGGRASAVESGTIGLLTINSIREIYKLPFTYLFSVVMPIGIGNEIHSWADIVGNINIIMVFISVGSFMFMFMRKKANRLVYWCCMGYYVISIIASIGIFRHYFSLLPFTYVAYSEFKLSANKNMLLIMYLLGAAYAMALMAFYLIG